MIPRETCPTCQGKGFWQSRRGGEKWPCGWCVEPTPRDIAAAEAKLSPAQWAFLRFGQHTLADQPMTPDQWDEHLVEYYVKIGEDINLGDGLVWPAPVIWFAAGHAHYKGDGGPWHLSFKYNALGLALRDSGSGPTGENPRNGVEGEAPQSGAPESAHRPTPLGHQKAATA